MTKFAKRLMIAAALTGAAAPALAAPANPAASLSVAKAVRADGGANHDSQLAGGFSSGTIALGIVGAIVILAIVLIATNDTPTSV